MEDFDYLSFSTKESDVQTLKCEIAEAVIQKAARNFKYNHVIKTQWQKIEVLEKEKQELIMEKYKLQNFENEKDYRVREGIELLKMFHTLQNEIFDITNKSESMDLATKAAKRKLIEMKKKVPEMELKKYVRQKLKQKESLMCAQIESIHPTLENLRIKKSSLESQISELFDTQISILETQKIFKSFMEKAREDISNIKAISKVLNVTGNEMAVAEFEKNVGSTMQSLRKNIAQQLQFRHNLRQYIEDFKKLMETSGSMLKSVKCVKKNNMSYESETDLKPRDSSQKLLIINFCNEAGTKNIKEACEAFTDVINENFILFRSIAQLQRKVDSLDYAITSYNEESEIMPTDLSIENRETILEIENYEEKTLIITRKLQDIENLSNALKEEIRYIKTIIAKLISLRYDYIEHSKTQDVIKLITDNDLVYYIYILKVRIVNMFTSKHETMFGDY